jgi:hypothetical protein
MVLRATVRDHDRDVLKRLLESARKFIERRGDERLEFLLAVVAGVAHCSAIASGAVRPGVSASTI